MIVIKGQYISKNESMIIQSIAVMLMVFHHLFGFPERISSDYIIISNFSFFHIGTILSYFGRICIGMFAFNSGYGMYKKLNSYTYSSYFDVIKKGYSCTLRQLKNFYIRYWIVFIAFIPMGIMFGRYKFNLTEFVLSLFGLVSPYNLEWWYVKCYCIFLLIFPLLYLIDYVLCKLMRSYVLFLVYGIALLIFAVFNNKLLFIENLNTYLCFFSGMVCVSLNLFDNLKELYLKIKWARYLIAVTVILLMVLVRSVVSTDCEYDFLFVPIFIFNICIVLKSSVFKKTVNKVLFIVGKYSMYIWLIHTFFAYYYFQNFTYFFRYSILIFIVCMLCSLACGIVLDFIYKKVSALFLRKDKRT